MFWRQTYRGQIGMVWTCAEEGHIIYWQKDAQDGATGQVVKKENLKGDS